MASYLKKQAAKKASVAPVKSATSPTYTAGNTRTDASGRVTALPDRVATSTGSKSFGANEAEQDAFAAGTGAGQPVITEAPVEAPVVTPTATPTVPQPAGTPPPTAPPTGTTPGGVSPAPTPTQNRYQGALATLQAGGTPAPQDPGQARSAVSGALPATPQDTTAVDNYISEDPAINSLMANIATLLNPQKQTTSLMQDYKSLYKQSGLDKINEELIDAETVINGSEDDLRNEIQTAGGLATDSQVQALALARNKGLLKRYNQLVQMKTDATNQLNTLSQLNAQDKEIAQKKVDSQISAMFNMVTFRQQAVNNVKEQARWMATQVGFDGIYNSYKSDPRQLANLEKTLGVAPGGLQGLATTASAERARKVEMENMDIAAKQASINASRASTRKTNLEIDALENPTNDLSRAGGTIGDIGALASDSALSSAVGPNVLARFNIFNPLTGKKANFIAGIEQLREQLTLDKLGEAKANGATFGALSDGERQTVAAAATKIGSWAIKDKTGKVTGYETSDTAFKQELDKINNFKKLDYIKKGGDPSQVGVKKLDDGSYWTQNSDNTYTKLN